MVMSLVTDEESSKNLLGADFFSKVLVYLPTGPGREFSRGSDGLIGIPTGWVPP